MTFGKCLDIERESKRLLLPFVMEKFGHAPREIPHDYESQRTGDWVITRRDNYEFTVELKAEEKFTGNVFLETMSNWHSSRYGWFLTSSAFQVWYVFLDLRTVYVLPLGVLRRWFWGSDVDPEDGACGRYRQVTQSKHQQKNMTQGYIVSVYDITAEVDGCEVVKLPTA
jgi:hypothetical protein